MLQTIGAQVALFTFSLAVVAGLQAGNSPLTILTRALICMVGGLFVGQVGAVVCKAVLRDHLQTRKQRIDTAHVKALEAAVGDIPVAGTIDEADGSQGGI
ncbi:MAG: hypothetical protein JNG88_14665 [Phycisphaerales bacterium]|nr:hypothetical protein [Phycisphaerales bacterium]